MARRETQQEPIISISPLAFGQELLGSSHTAVFCAHDSLHQQEIFSFMEPLPQPCSGQQGQQLPDPQTTTTAGLVCSTVSSSGDPEVLEASWLGTSSTPSPFLAKPHETLSVCAGVPALPSQGEGRSTAPQMGRENSTEIFN